MTQYARPSDPVLDVGGGASHLVDYLIEREYVRVAVLDISAAPLRVAKARLGARARKAEWIVADITAEPPLPPVHVWHDRAVLHFLTSPGHQTGYARTAAATVSPGGRAVIAAFAPDGPETCSGLAVQRHDGASVARLLGRQFDLVEEQRETHVTPSGKEQRFVWAVLKRL